MQERVTAQKANGDADLIPQLLCPQACAPGWGGFILLPFSFAPPLGLYVRSYLCMLSCLLGPRKAGHLHFVTGNICGNTPICNGGEGVVWLKSN